jgi:hypothetical protein
VDRHRFALQTGRIVTGNVVKVESSFRNDTRQPRLSIGAAETGRV